jgi:long-chain acyl-CoA synthetase
MTNINDAQKNWGSLPEVLDQGVETLPQLLVYQTRRFGDHVLHRKKDFGIWQRYSYKGVLNQVKTFAMGLASLGVERGQTVGIVGENEPELFWSEYAAQSIGATPVCLYPDMTPAQMEHILSHSDAVVMVCEDQEQVDKVLELEEKLPAIFKIIYWDDRGMWKYDHPKLMTFKKVQEMGVEYIRIHPDKFEEAVAAGKSTDIAILSYTSGTTGLPKGCIMTYANLFDTVFRLAGAIQMKPFLQYLSYISPGWSAEQMFGISMGLLIPFVVNFPEEPETVLENIREIGAEALVFTPPQWESFASLVESKMIEAGPIRNWFFKKGLAVGAKVNLAKLEGGKVSFWWRLLYPLADKGVLYPLRDNLGLQAVYFALSGGSSMAPDVFRFFHSMGVPLRNIFGTTEMSFFTMHQGETYDLETVGKWLAVHPHFGPPLEYKVTDEAEILVKGGSGFVGYYKNKEATEEKMDGGWYRTGDAVHITEKNEVVYLDRVDHMRKLSTGHFYPPQYIESRLRFSPFIKNAMTIGDQDKPFVAAMLNIDASTVGPWAEQRRIGYTTFSDLSQNKRIRELIKAEIEKVNSFLPEGSRVKRFINFPKELDPDEDELTRSRKIRRDFLEKKYARFISVIYSGETEFKAEVPVKYQDGRTGVVNAIVYVNDLVQEENRNQ